MKIFGAFFVILSVFLLPVAYNLAPVYAQAATLTLSPSSGTVNRNCNFSLDVMLNTGGAPTDGTDAILVYDTSKFTATTITPGSLYSEYPGNSIREDLGKLTISGLASVDKPFSGQGKLATVNFTVKETAPTGASQITFLFDANDKSNTTDSNVVERSSGEILNSVVNGNYTIGTGTCASGTIGSTGTGSGTGSNGGIDASDSAQVKVPFKELPQGGTKEFTLMLAIVGTTLTVLGIIGMALL